MFFHQLSPRFQLYFWMRNHWKRKINQIFTLLQAPPKISPMEIWEESVPQSKNMILEIKNRQFTWNSLKLMRWYLMPPLVKTILWKKLVNRSGKAPRSSLKVCGCPYREKKKRLIWSPCKDLREDRISHIMAHHMGFLYPQLGPQGQCLCVKRWQTELAIIVPAQPARWVSRRNPLVYQKSQTQDGQTSPHDSFCSNDLHQRTYFSSL